ncbi:LuxR C-terminal-related transcriptional regulator [Streptomyces sp. CC219B]|uniref:response regulator transcription factor n=1 Tax=Streptomyces sp. CC219B TaxID=3044574 RepID=UPI0024A9ADAA|nr:LuxR C-terminal-related transcriptional regulator [Streptomyces sp. CC219B]
MDRIVTELTDDQWNICQSRHCNEKSWTITDGAGLSETQGFPGKESISGARPALIFVCSDAGDPMIPDALSCGVAALVATTDAVGTWEAAVRQAAAGGNWISPVVAAHFLEPRRALSTRIRVMSDDRLTPAQQEVLNLMITGMTRAEVAVKLSIQESTVAYHIRRGLQRLGCANIREVQARIIKEGLGIGALDALRI